MQIQGQALPVLDQRELKLRYDVFIASRAPGRATLRGSSWCFRRTGSAFVKPASQDEGTRAVIEWIAARSFFPIVLGGALI